MRRDRSRGTDIWSIAQTHLAHKYSTNTSCTLCASDWSCWTLRLCRERQQNTKHSHANFAISRLKLNITHPLELPLTLKSSIHQYESNVDLFHEKEKIEN